MSSGCGFIGKEADRWEEQFYLGLDPEAQIKYGRCEVSGEQLRACLRQAVKLHGNETWRERPELLGSN